MCLHETNIIQRDIKPENIFIDNFDFSSSQFYIADFDCSKKVEDKYNVTQTKQDSSYTQKYDPSEFQQTLKYDIFQFGLVLLSDAKKGKYIGEELGPRNLSEQQFNSFYSRQAIEESLSSINYDEMFIDAIASCLLKDPKNRPDIKTLYYKLKIQKFYLQNKKNR